MITIARLNPISLLLILSLYLAASLCSAEPVARLAAAEQPALSAASTPATNAFHPLSPGPIDGAIASATAYMLTNYHYLKKPFDESVSSQFLDRYLETLDPQHIHFTQADLADFEQYRTNLNHLTLPGKNLGDTRPACEIFNRYMERLQQRTTYADELLQHEKFTFDKDERILMNRKQVPYPADLNEAKKLWRERLRFEYLQELLGKIGARKKNLAAAAKNKVPQAETNAIVKSTAPTGSAARAETRRAPAIGSPKGGEQKPATQAVAGEGLPKAEVLAKPGAAETRATPLTPSTGVAPPKKTDDEEVVETLSHRYHRTLRFFTEWTNEDVLQTYLTALARVYDPHSDYLGRPQLEQFSISMNLSLFGIGAELISEDGYCKIRRLLPGGPAFKSKLIKENDRIVAVAQSNQPPVDVVEMSLNKAVQLIRGPKGTEVQLTIIPAGTDASTRTVVTLVRDQIPLEDSAAKAKIIEMPDSHGGTLRLGVIDLPSFYATFDTSASKDKPEPKSTTADVAKLLDKLKQEKVAGVILDLRFNGGGSLDEAIKLTGLFVRTNPVVLIRDEQGRRQEADDPDPSVRYEGPLVVLTSRHSASASEILAGALQDYGRALIVGDSSTHGKGTVQQVNQLRSLIRMDRSLTNDPGALKLTIKKFFRPSGASTQLKGVIPDIVLPSVANESKDIGERALDNPLPWDTISGAKYDHFNLVEPYLGELRRRSVDRVAADKEFAYVREDVELFKKHQADKTISLNEQQRLMEQEDNEARQKARDKERLTRPEPQQKVYEITLKLADLPGLPPPVARTNAALAKLSAHPIAGPSGNATKSAAASAPSGDDADEADAEKPVPTDAPLLEAEHILVDYLSLLPKGSPVTAGQ
jgi:carboxyl-terminal processing protease